MNRQRLRDVRGVWVCIIWRIWAGASRAGPILQAVIALALGQVLLTRLARSGEFRFGQRSFAMSLLYDPGGLRPVPGRPRVPLMQGKSVSPLT